MGDADSILSFTFTTLPLTCTCSYPTALPPQISQCLSPPLAQYPGVRGWSLKSTSILLPSRSQHISVMCPRSLTDRPCLEASIGQSRQETAPNTQIPCLSEGAWHNRWNWRSPGDRTPLSISQDRSGSLTDTLFRERHFITPWTLCCLIPGHQDHSLE